MAFFLLLFMISQAYAVCFIDQFSPGKRSVLNRTSVVDELHCKILCYKHKECEAYTFDRGLKGCAQHGPVVGLTCTLPTHEMLRSSENCPRIEAQTLVTSAYTQNPLINASYMIDTHANTISETPSPSSMPCGVGYNAIDLLMPDMSHKVVSSADDVGLAWDRALGVWYYLEGGVHTYIRAAACFTVPLADADALREAACAPLPAIREIPGYGPPSLFNRTWPCSDGKATVVKYELLKRRAQETKKHSAWINCVYGTWLYLTDHKYKQTKGITAASCV